MNQCVFLAGLMVEPSSFHNGKKNFFCYQAPVPRLTKTCFSAFSQFVKIHLGNTVLFHDKSDHGTVFLET